MGPTLPKVRHCCFPHSDTNPMGGWPRLSTVDKTEFVQKQVWGFLAVNMMNMHTKHGAGIYIYLYLFSFLPTKLGDFVAHVIMYIFQHPC